jgi:hypothetical protein
MNVRKKETGKGRCRILTNTENRKLYTDVRKAFTVNRGQRKNFRKAESRSDENKEIRDLIKGT